VFPHHVSGPSFFPIVASVPATRVYTSALYPSTPVVYPQPAPVAIPAPLPMPTLIEYPTGWYQLRGDGMTNPYVWVWIPKPPPPPPEAPPAPPAGPPAPGSPPAMPPVQQPSAPRSELYRWTDEQGVVNWTDKLGKIPEQYRPLAQRLS